MPGRRSTAQAERLDRVKDAAWRLYQEYGYEATTIRKIAAEAGVATGTVINAGDKGGLLVALFEDAIRARVRHSAPPVGADLVEQVWSRFMLFFDFYATQPSLTRAYLQELLAGRADNNDGPGLVAEFLEQLIRAVKSTVPEGDADEVQLLVEQLFSVYLSALVGWLTGSASFDQAVQRCHQHVVRAVQDFRSLEESP